MKGKITAVCISDTKGVRKTPCPSGVFLENYGMANDAHAERGIKRQVSLLTVDSIEKMKNMGLHVGRGDFAENLTTRGLDLCALPVGTRLRVGGKALLEMTQIGKICHERCAIFHQAGDCVMPREGIFVRVCEEGPVRTGDEIVVLEG